MIKFDLIITDEVYINKINKLNKNRINKISNIKKCYMKSSFGFEKVLIEDEYNYNRKKDKYRILFNAINPINFKSLFNRIHVFSDNDITFGVINYILKDFNFDSSDLDIYINGMNINSFKIKNIVFTNEEIEELYNDVSFSGHYFESFANQLKDYIRKSDDFALIYDRNMNVNYKVFVMDLKTKMITRYIFLYNVYDDAYNILINDVLSRSVSISKSAMKALSRRIDENINIAKLDERRICYFAKPLYYKDVK